MNPIQKAIQHVGGPTRMARLLGVKPNVVGMWSVRGKAPGHYCVRIEAVTAGAVSVGDLDPMLSAALEQSGYQRQAAA